MLDYHALPMHKIPVGVLGASGYAGRELCALLAAHPRLTLAFATADRRRGERVRVGPPYAPPVDLVFQATDDAPLYTVRVVAELPLWVHRCLQVMGCRSRITCDARWTRLVSSPPRVQIALHG
jgi:hypothetical protein